MISQTVEYALRAVVFLAEHPETRWTARQIAERTQVPAGYLSKVLQGLAREGIVDSQRGPNGGFFLGRPPKDLSIFEVVQAVDPIPRIHACPLKLEAHSEHLCPLHRRLDRALAVVEESFRESNLADLVAQPTFRRPRPGGGRRSRKPSAG